MSGDTAARYGWVNRSIPNAQLDGFVDGLARRIASYQTRTIELAKKTINARAGVPACRSRPLGFEPVLPSRRRMA